MNDITLQVNLSAGDVNYAALTVPALVQQHADIKKRLLVVDCCRPQKSRIMDPDIKFPIKKFEEGVEKIIAISESLLAQNVVSEIYYIKPGDPLIDKISKKYLNGLYKTTHAAGGTGNMSYWIGIDIPDTRYVLHYDGDIMMYQKQGFNWISEAITHMAQNDDVVISVPRLCPPVKDNPAIPSLHEGRQYTTHDQYWKNDWFSTRHFLLDKQKMDMYLPLVRGKVKLELLLRKYGKRAFPIDPEILMFKSLAPRGAKRLVLRNEDAWVAHPVDKSAVFLRSLPKILSMISEGRFPEEQRGCEDMNLNAWLNYIDR